MTLAEAKLPPHNLDAEEAVLGSILIDGDLIKSIGLMSDDFYHEDYNQIFGAMLQLKEKALGINQITVAQELDESDKLEAAGGAAILSHLISITPTSMDCHHYAEIVKRLSILRRMIVVSERIAAIGYDSQGNITEALAKADKLLLELRRSSGSSHIITPEGRSSILMDRYTDLYTKDKGVAVSTGLIDLDTKLGSGLFPGDLIIVGARPGVGKTSLLECISNHIGRQHNVLFCSAEMNVEGLSDRDVAGVIGIPVGQVRQGGYEEGVYQNIIDKAIPYISELNIYHMDITRTYQLTTANVYQAAFELHARHGLALVVVDYLGILNDRFGNNNNDRIGYITRNLKQMAMTLDIPVLCAHQLNRALEVRDEKRPQLHDLRDSGNVEQDADIILFIYRESYYNRGSDSKVTEILIAKQRQGPSGKGIKVLWDDVAQTYRNMVL